jgi:hypothetical protein
MPNFDFCRILFVLDRVFIRLFHLEVNEKSDFTKFLVQVFNKQKFRPNFQAEFLLKAVNSKLNVQIFHIERVVFDKFTSRLDLVAH